MQIVCRSCAAKYEVPTSRISPRRKVRCARCGNAWLASEEPVTAPTNLDPLGFRAEPDVEHEADSVPQLPPITAMDRLTEAAPRSHTSVVLIAAWVMTFVVVIAAVGVVITWREPLVRAWPASSRILGRVEPVAQSPAHNAAKTEAAATKK
jgi:predicted Zn finger-like uncharacterized protein